MTLVADPSNRRSWHSIVFIAIVVFLLSPYGSPPVALALGLLLAFTVGNPFPELSGKPTKYLLQASVVLLGFGMNLEAIVKMVAKGFFSPSRPSSARLRSVTW